MRKWICLLLALVILAAAVPLAGMGCSSEEEETGAIKIGVLLDNSGANKPLGDPEKQTLELLQEQINANGGIDGRQIEIVFRDYGKTGADVVALANELIDQQNVVAIIGTTGTTESLAIIDAVDSAKTPNISLAADERITLPVGTSKWVFKTPQTTFMAVEQVYAYIEDQGITDIAIMTDKLGFGAGGKKDLQELADSYNLDIVSDQQFNNDDSTWDSYIENIKDSGAKAVVVWGTNPGPANFAKALKNQAPEIAYFGSHGIANKSFITLAGTAANGVIFPSGKLIVASQLPDSDVQKDVLLDFIADYETKYGPGTCNTFAGHAYDALSMLKIAIEEAGSTDKAKVRSELEKIKDFAGTGGIFTMSKEDHCGLSTGCMVNVKIENGQWVLLT
jgi:branched-chain amino acid transport system substrate-binding protein